MDAKAQNPLRGKNDACQKHPPMGDLSQNGGHEKATKLPQNYGEAFPPKSGGTFPPKYGGAFPPKSGGTSPRKKKPLGLEPKCAAAVLPKHTIYKFSDHPCSIFHTLRLSGPAPSCQRRGESLSSFSFPPHVMALELVYSGCLGGCVVSRPGAPRSGSGRHRGVRSRGFVSCEG